MEGQAAVGNDDDLVNLRLVKAWLWWILALLTIFPLVGLLVSIKFHSPEFHGKASWLTFGRLRLVHVNGVIFGAFSMLMFGLKYYLVPRMCGRHTAKELWGIELGKMLPEQTIVELNSAGEPQLGHDGSTNALIRRYRRFRNGRS
jgi:cbb3-type cytochrome oxidase subunit 1